jgi:ribosome-binding factor A
MQAQRHQKVTEQIAHLAADFLGKESNRQSMITVTRASISSDLKNATVFFTVLPDEYEGAALNFAKRKRTEFRGFVKKHTGLRRLPFFEFEIDRGEKHRQHLDTLSL